MTVDSIIENQYRQALANSYLRACEVELQALKPGNVSVDAPGHGMCAAQFIATAKASVDALVIKNLSLGERIYYAVAASLEKVSCNTNLGIVLLCGPLLHAMLNRTPEHSLRTGLSQVLSAADVSDAEWIYRAIRLAAPGGLGRSPAYDVKDAPPVPVVTAMQAAAHRDRIALQYITGFSDIFDYAVPRLIEARTRWNSDKWALVALFLSLLGRFPDSHIARKYGQAQAEEVSAKATRLNNELSRCDVPEEFTQRLEIVDVEFKSAGINPGTTADLTVATLVVYYLEKIISTDSRDLSLISNAQGNRYAGRDDAQDGRAAEHNTAARRAGSYHVSL